jgi:hypothetical protein
MGERTSHNPVKRGVAGKIRKTKRKSKGTGNGRAAHAVVGPILVRTGMGEKWVRCQIRMRTTNVHGNTSDGRSKLQTGNAHGCRCPILLRTDISKNISFGPLKASSDGDKRTFSPTCAKLLSGDLKGTSRRKRFDPFCVQRQPKNAHLDHDAYDICGKPDVRKGPSQEIWIGSTTA